jgi:molybdate transport system permease protein
MAWQVAAGLLATLLVAPVAWLLWLAATSSLGAAFTDPSVLDALWLSLATTAASLAVIIGLGTPLAWMLARHSGRVARVMETAIDLPLVLPPAVAGLALLLLLGRRGPLGSVLDGAGVSIAFSTLAVVLAQTFVAAPFYVRSVRAGFVAIGHEVRDAAQIDGADEWQVFRHIGIPLATSAVATGAVLAWARALGEFGATILFAGNLPGVTQTLPLEVYSAFQTNLDAAIGAAALLVIAAALVLGLLRWAGSTVERPLA